MADCSRPVNPIDFSVNKFLKGRTRPEEAPRRLADRHGEGEHAVNPVSIRGWSAIGLVALVLGSGGCGTVPPLEEPDTGIDAPYVIGSGDTLNIVVWRNLELSVTVPVRPD